MTQVDILEQRAIHVIVFELREEADIRPLKEPCSLLQAFKLLDEIFVVHRHHPLEGGQKISRIDFNLGHLLKDDLSFVLVKLILNEGTNRSKIPADVSRWDCIELNDISSVERQVHLYLPFVHRKSVRAH